MSGSGVDPAGERELAERFSEHRDRLWRMVRARLDRRLWGRVDPDDVLQEAYLDATTRLGHYPGAEAMSYFLWLRLVVGQTLVDVHRRHLEAQKRDAGRDVPIARRSGPDASSASLAGQLVADLTSPSQVAIRQEMEEQLRRAIDSMEPIDREVLTLRHFEELSNLEVAEVLAIRPKAASVRYIRAAARLKATLSRLPGFAEEMG